MSERRKITVGQDNPIYQEYDREVLVELWSNPNQTVPMRLSREEAQDLQEQLTNFLWRDE